MASEPVRISETIRFGDDFELDLRFHELRRDGRPLKIERLPISVLVLLIEYRGQIVSRDQIVERVWGKGVFLDTDNSINAAIRKIRQVLKDDPERPRYVQTITGRGYRFIAEVIDPNPVVNEQPVPEQSLGPERLIGAKISHYRILQVLGGGGMGVVYKAEDLKLGRRVAIKFLPGELASDPRAFARLELEARAASSLEHRNVCSIYELGEYEGQPFIVMQLLEGQTLREWIEATEGQSASRRLPQVLDLAIQIAEGLDAAHQKGIIHRDIKPANIFITNRGEAKILDFGVAKFLDHAESLPAATSSAQDSAPQTNPTLTQSTTSVGTPSYLSPEQIRGEKLDPRTDLFSFGLVLYEMATDRRAFAGKTVTAIRDAVLRQATVPIRQLNPELPAKLEVIIAKALDKDRDRRFQSAGELRTAVEQLRDGLEPAAKWPSGRLRWLTGGAAAILLAGSLYLANNTRQRLWRGAGLISSPTIKPRRSVAVLGFKNLSGKSDKAWISAALAEMLSTELAAGQHLRTISGEDVARMQFDLSLPAADSYSRDTLTRIRNHSNTDLVVLGSYLAVANSAGGKVRLDLQLQDARGGETVGVISEDGTETELPDMVSRAATGLRQTLGITAISSGEAREVQASMPANPDAARFYTEGLSKLRVFDALAARDLLDKAVAADPNHALSHSALAESWSKLGYDSKALEEAKKAFDLSAELPREERLSIEGRYREFSNELPAAIEIYRTLRNFFPDNIDYALRLAKAQTTAGLGKDVMETVALMRRLPEPINQDARIDLAEASGAELRGDLVRSQQAAVAAGAKAEAQGNPLQMATAESREAWASVHLGDPNRALAAYLKSRELWMKAGNPRGAASAQASIAHLQGDEGDFVAARNSFTEALKEFRRIGDMGNLASCAHNFGVLLTQEGDLQQARKYLEEALSIQREMKNERGTASDLDDIGNVMLGLGDLSGALQVKGQALEIFRRLGNKFGEKITLLNTGEVLLAQGQLQMAKEKFEQVLIEVQKDGDKREAGDCLADLAAVLTAQDRLDDARSAAEQSITIRREVKNEVRTAQSRLQLAKIALEQGKAGEAESLARNSIAVFDKQTILGDSSRSYAVLSRALLAEGRNQEAQSAAERALSLSQQSSDLGVHFEATLAEQAVQAQSGKLEHATRVLETVLGETRSHGFSGVELETRLLLGQIELRSGTKTAVRVRLQRLQNDAHTKGFVLIARKAAAALGDNPGHTKAD